MRIAQIAIVTASTAIGGLMYEWENDDALNVAPGTVTYTANLSATSEIPPPTGSPTATGVATLTLSPSNELTVNVRVTGDLTAGVTMAHIHGPATTTSNAGIVLDFVPSMTAVIDAGTRTGTLVSTSYDLKALPVASTSVLRVSADSLIAFLNSGRAYVNVHTSTNAPGEIRGQITR